MNPTPSPILSFIAAVARNGVIGVRNTLPWHLPADLKHFKHLTLGKPILMGRATHQSLGRPLPGRDNIVITRDLAYPAPGCTLVHSVDQALAVANGAEELMVIGGAQLYAQLLPQAQRLYLTLVHGHYAGDAYFPRYEPAHWHELSRDDHPIDANHAVAYSFVTLERRVA